MIEMNEKIDYDIKIDDIKLKLYEDSKNNKSSLLGIKNSSNPYGAVGRIGPATIIYT